MCKNILIVLTFSFLIFIFGVNATPLYGEKCVVATNFSSVDFYKVDTYSFKDAFMGNGVSATYPTNYNYVNKIVDYYNAKLTFETTLEGYASSYYYYSSSLPNTVIINGKKVNVHIVITNDSITVGYPLVYYAY